jgi:uncharacterized hydrophobic protein (TIGR00271 family)
VIHLRLIVPSDLISAVTERLRDRPGVAHVAHLQSVSTSPPGEVVICDVVREAANDLIEWLQQLGIHHRGAITIEALEAVVSDAAERAEAQAPGHAADALVWEELESRARAETPVTTSFLIVIGIAAVIAGVGILLDAPILIVGAMVVGPEYGPLAALSIAVVRRRAQQAARAAATLGCGLAVAAVAAFVATVIFRTTGLAPDRYELTDRELTAFISHPNGMAAVVAVLAGVVGMLSLTEARSGALIGVLVSVTTIPAVANIGVATAYREWSEVWGSALQLLINLAGIVLAGVATLAVQARATDATARS